MNKAPAQVPMTRPWAAPETPPAPPDPDHPFITHKSKDIFCGHCGEPEVIQLSCGKRSCAPCRSRWFGIHYDSFVELVKSWRSIRFLTLTLVNVFEIGRGDVARLRRCLAELRRRFPAIAVGFYVVQAPSRNDPKTGQWKGWHLHAHALYDGAYIKQADLSKAWFEITGDSKIVGIEKVRSPETAVRYLLKDFLQGPHIRPEDVEDFDAIFKGARMVQPFGSHAEKAKLKLPERVRKPHPCKKCGWDCWIGSLDPLFRSPVEWPLDDEFEDDS